jgi:hypothetical protein
VVVPISRILVVAALVFSLIACSRKEIHAVELRALPADKYMLDGSLISHSELTQRLKALLQPNYHLCIEVTPLEGMPYANTEALMHEMHEMQNAGVDCIGTSGVDKPN